MNIDLLTKKEQLRLEIASLLIKAGSSYLEGDHIVDWILSSETQHKNPETILIIPAENVSAWKLIIKESGTRRDDYPSRLTPLKYEIGIYKNVRIICPSSFDSIDDLIKDLTF